MRELKKHMPTQRTGVTREGEMTPEIIRSILDHTGDARLKAAILLMLTSGLRVGEMCQLSIIDIDLKNKTVHVSDLIAKTGVARTTFFTDECKDALEAYLKEREAYIERSKTFTPRLKREFKESELVFPVTPNAIRNGLNATLKKAGLFQIDPRTNRANIHPHSFRKYFSSTLKLSGMPDDIVEYLMGHSNGLTSAYRTYGISQLRDQYQKVSFCLHVDYSYTAQTELKTQVSDATVKVSELEKVNKQLKDRLAVLESDKAAFSNDLSKMTSEEKMNLARKYVEQMQKLQASMGIQTKDDWEKTPNTRAGTAPDKA